MWEELCSLKDTGVVGEWCVVGDFNVVSSLEEGQGVSVGAKGGWRCSSLVNS